MLQLCPTEMARGVRTNVVKLIVGITGASGVIYGIRLLEFLSKNEAIETHLIISEAGERK